MKYLRFLGRYTKGQSYKVLVLLCTTSLYVAVTLTYPLLLQFTIDHVIDHQPITNPMWVSLTNALGGLSHLKSNIWILAVLLIGMHVIYGITRYLTRIRSVESMSEVVGERLRNDLYDHLQTLPYAYHVKAKTGDLIQRCTSDVDLIIRFLSNQTASIAYALVMIFISMAILFNIYAPLAWITMVSFPIIFTFSFVFFKRMQSAFKESDEAEGALSNTFQESMDAVRVVKAFNREAFELEKFTEKNKTYRSKTQGVIFQMALYWSISDAICFLQILAVLISSIFLVRQNAISMGQALVFVSYVGMVLWPVRNLGRVLSDMGKVSVSIDRIQDILNVEKEDLLTGDTIDFKGNIRFDHVSFQYDDGDYPVLNDVTFTIESGETIAIMGPTGSGKSSLMHLLTRLYDATEGQIFVDTHDITTVSRKSIREQVGIVLQEPYLFSKTIYENIKLGVPHATQESVEKAARIAAIHDVIVGFDQGYDTAVGEKGVTLSGGQKQRVAIARTVIQNQPLVIFDDSLSALDTKTDAAIRDALGALDQGQTTLIITHRVNSAQAADRILVLDQGRIVQSGTHESLMASPGLYQTIASIQSQGGDIE